MARGLRVVLAAILAPGAAAAAANATAAGRGPPALRGAGAEVSWAAAAAQAGGGNVTAMAAPAPAQGPALAQGLFRTSGTMTLYHTTSPEVAELILQGGFKPGSEGWCGGAIYFIDTPVLPESKYSPTTTQDGAILEVEVDMGRTATMDEKCSADYGVGVQAALAHGFDSVSFNPGDGVEFVIADDSRIRSIRRYQ